MLTALSPESLCLEKHPIIINNCEQPESTPYNREHEYIQDPNVNVTGVGSHKTFLDVYPPDHRDCVLSRKEYQFGIYSFKLLVPIVP